MFGIGGGRGPSAVESQDIVAARGAADGEPPATAEAAPNLDLTMVADGESAVVAGFSGGEAEVARLESMGLRPGAIVRKKSAALNQGPVVVERGSSQLALAYGIARGILVEPLR